MGIDGLASSRRPSHATIACPTCGVYQPVEIDYEGHQGCAALPAAPCPVCHRDLCCFCDQVECECGKVVCLDCTAIVPDGTPSGLRLCKPCAQGDPLCPACAQFACMIPRENSGTRWSVSGLLELRVMRQGDFSGLKSPWRGGAPRFLPRSRRLPAFH